jgi:hypothetical protein
MMTCFSSTARHIAIGVVFGTMSWTIAVREALAQHRSHQLQDQPPSSITVGHKTVEVIGLRRWTLGMVQDSLKKYAPEADLGTHACAAILRYKLGFADAASSSYIEQSTPDARTPQVERVTVLVMEPQDSARIRSRAVPLDSTAPYAPWQDIRALVRTKPNEVSTAIQLGGLFEPDSMASWLARFSRDTASIRRAWQLRSRHATPGEHATARDLLVSSPDMFTRISAVLVLTGAGDRDSTSHALVQAMLESEGAVRSFAASALQAVSREHPRRRDWTPVAPAIHAILDGTGLYQLTPMVSALNATQVGPSDARAFLANGGRMLLNLFQSSFPSNREPAHKLLIALRGKDLGSAVGPWRAWIESL